MLHQLCLPIQLIDDSTFINFFQLNNEQLIASLQQATESNSGSFIYLWGSAGTGRSHLLRATCAHADSHEITNGYLPLDITIAKNWPKTIFAGLDKLSIICIDNIEAIAGQLGWEQELFDFYNQWKEKNQGALIISALAPAKQISFVLPDLVSRLHWGLTYHTPTLTEANKLAILRFRAERRGMYLSMEVGQFLLNRISRDMHSLIQALNLLDTESIRTQRKLTVPFVKIALNL